MIENLVITKFYLDKAFGENNVILLIDKSDLYKINAINKRIFVLCPPYLLPYLNMNFDLHISTMSYQHMTKNNLDFYFREIKRLKVKYLFLNNRTIKRDSTDIPIDDYDLRDKYEIIDKKMHLFSKYHKEILFKLREKI